ncbi:hypothetical protein N5D52_20720, partial [Pseudomonas sp. GD03860]|nr:hypothetical protein [Pseudomonas sp. GD03860]
LMDDNEATLLAQYRIPANAGHMLHRGNPREDFIQIFLESHLSSNVAIGTGEIIDAYSKPRGQRNQYDIVIYRKNFPKLVFGGRTHGFLAESVVATIEVKSILDQAAMDQAVEAAYKAKQLERNFIQLYRIGWTPLMIANYVVSYTGPAKMETVYGWMEKSYKKYGIPFPVFNGENRNVPGTALDGIFVLGKGFIRLENTPGGLRIPPDCMNAAHSICDVESGSLLALFVSLQEQCSHLDGVIPHITPYLANVPMQAKFI